MRPTMRYSESFKLQVMRELEAGRFKTRSAAARAYGIGAGSIEHWAKKYGKQHLLGRVIRVETPKEKNELRELRKHVKTLEKALVESHLEQRLDKARLEIACRMAGIEDVEGFKKKHALKQ